MQAHTQCPDTRSFAIVALLQNPLGYHDLQGTLENTVGHFTESERQTAHLKLVKIFGFHGRCRSKVDETQRTIIFAVENVLRFTITMPNAVILERDADSDELAKYVP